MIILIQCNLFTSLECRRCCVMDGCMKGSRLVCAADDVIELKSNELGTVMTGCRNNPLKGSYYCLDHQYLEQVRSNYSISALVYLHAHHFHSNCIIICIIFIFQKDTLPPTKKPKLDAEVEELECKTTKSQYAADKDRSAGTVYAVYNCGIIAGIDELFGCESLKQIYIFMEFLEKNMIKFPDLWAYDDACHLKRFVNKRQTTLLGKKFADLVMVVDKMHFANHKDPWCRKNVNPHLVEAFNSLNTEAYEQTFRHVTRYKFATKHMSFGMYNLFHLTMADIYNHDKLILSNKPAPKKKEC